MPQTGFYLLTSTYLPPTGQQFSRRTSLHTRKSYSLQPLLGVHVWTDDDDDDNDDDDNNPPRHPQAITCDAPHHCIEKSTLFSGAFRRRKEECARPTTSLPPLPPSLPTNPPTQ